MDQEETIAAILAAALIRNSQVISADTAVELYEKCLADLRAKEEVPTVVETPVQRVA